MRALPSSIAEGFRERTVANRLTVDGAPRYAESVAEIVLFHHAQGLTAGVQAFADELRSAGHVVHTPDLYDGNTFDDLDDGVGYAKEVGFGTILERGQAAAADLSSDIVYAGFSLGVMPAQMLAQTRSGAKGALFFSAALPPSEFDGPWPDGVPLQIHMMEDDEWAQEDLPAAREIVEEVEAAELFLYPGDRHLFADNSLPDYDESATMQLKPRVLSFLDAVDR
jgi:dienelactone hydrolase